MFSAEFNGFSSSLKKQLEVGQSLQKLKGSFI